MRTTLYICLLAGAAMAQIPTAPPEAPPRPAGTGLIEGVVSDAATHAPLGKAQVTVSGAIPAPLTAVTSADGRFAFHELPEGSYWLNAAKPGYNPPATIFASDSNTGVVLNKGEERKGVAIALVPGGEIAGRVVDEEGMPIRGCGVTAVEPGYEQNRPSLNSVAAGSPSNDKGEYRLINLTAGRYYLFAQCMAELPAAHPLLPRGDPRTPHETYLPQFLGGGLDPAMATRLTIVAGAALQGVDFQMTRVPSFTLRGSVAVSDPVAYANGVNVMLMPANPLMRNLTLLSGPADQQSHKFQIQPMLPGSYVLFAFTTNEHRLCTAQRPMEIGTAPPDPLEIALECGAELKGSVQFDSDDQPAAALENQQITLLPLEGPSFMLQPHTQTDKDGAFTFTGVPAGRWRMLVSAPGYIKSISIAGQDVSPDSIQLGAGAAGPMRIVIGNKSAEVRVEVAGAPPTGRSPRSYFRKIPIVWATVWSVRELPWAPAASSSGPCPPAATGFSRLRAKVPG